MSGIDGKIIAITGASNGMGEATALELARRGQRSCWGPGVVANTGIARTGLVSDLDVDGVGVIDAIRF